MKIAIVLFIYKKYNETLRMVDSLLGNNNLDLFNIFIYSDGPKNENEDIIISELRNEISKRFTCKKINFIKQKNNLGLSKSIINGVTNIFNHFDAVIVLEDDLITSPNFLQFMKNALEFYEYQNIIHSISGYTPNLRSIKYLQFDSYFTRRSSSWGWATWRDRWIKVDWEISDFNEFRWHIQKRLRFNAGGSDMSRMLIDQQNGKIDSWAIRWCYSQFNNKMLSVFPKTSKISNIGIGKNATNTKRGRRFDSILDIGDKTNFLFDPNVSLNSKFDKEFRSIYSLKNRILSKLFNY